MNNNIPNTTVIQLVISGFVDSREVVNKLNEFYTNTGVVVSQRAKYEKPTWFYILAALSRHPQTVQEIMDTLKSHNLNLGYQSVLRFLKIMMNTEKAIHPHRRNCGIGCHEAVNLFGGIKRTVCAVYTGANPADTFQLNCNDPAENFLFETSL